MASNPGVWIMIIGIIIFIIEIIYIIYLVANKKHVDWWIYLILALTVGLIVIGILVSQMESKKAKRLKLTENEIETE